MSNPNPNPKPPAEQRTIRRFDSPYEERIRARDAKGLRAVLESPLISDEGKMNAAQALRRTETIQAQNTAPDLSPAERDRIAKRTQALEDKIKEGLLSPEEMRRNPHGAGLAVANHQRANATNILRWRNGLHALNKGADAATMAYLTNLDRLRPRTSTMSMVDCQIPQRAAHSFPSPAFQANYDAIDFSQPADSALGEQSTRTADPHRELLEQFDGEDEAPVSAAPKAPEPPRAPLQNVTPQAKPGPNQPPKGHPNQQRR